VSTGISRISREISWSPEGHDACLGTLPGVRAACCGHGKTKGYVLFESGLMISGTFEHAPRKPQKR
jgi:hypothetical protein